MLMSSIDYRVVSDEAIIGLICGKDPLWPCNQTLQKYANSEDYLN